MQTNENMQNITVNVHVASFLYLKNQNWGIQKIRIRTS
jgi:hypothetical protein